MPVFTHRYACPIMAHVLVVSLLPPQHNDLFTALFPDKSVNAGEMCPGGVHAQGQDTCGPWYHTRRLWR